MEEFETLPKTKEEAAKRWPNLAALVKYWAEEERDQKAWTAVDRCSLPQRDSADIRSDLALARIVLRQRLHAQKVGRFMQINAPFEERVGRLEAELHSATLRDRAFQDDMRRG